VCPAGQRQDKVIDLSPSSVKPAKKRIAGMLTAYGATALVFLVLDGIWLLLVARTFYQKQLGHLFRQPFHPVPAVLFYLIYVGALTVLAVHPAVRDGEGWSQAALMGGVLGLAAYGTYDLTNHATLKSWPLAITLVDLAWGTFVSAATAGAAAALLAAMG
jgi:uncharacterized membrane protein